MTKPKNQLPIERKTSNTPNPQELISTDRVIEIAKRLGVSFGHGDAAERIRYFVKLGILPHAIRKSKVESQSEKNLTNSPLSSLTLTTVGHFPYWVVKRIVVVDRLKRGGMSYGTIAAKFINLDTDKLPLTPAESQPFDSSQVKQSTVNRQLSTVSGVLSASASLWKKAGISEEELDRKLHQYQMELDTKLEAHKQELERKINYQIDQSNLKDNISKLNESDLNKLSGYQSYLKTEPEVGDVRDFGEVREILSSPETDYQPASPAKRGEQPNTTRRSFKKPLFTSALAALFIFVIILSIIQSPPVRQALNKADQQKAHLIASETRKHAQKMGAVLAASSEANFLYIDAVTEFLGETTFLDPITAPNVIYSLTAGTGIAVTGGQNPIVSLDSTALVTTLNNTSGTLTIAGSGGTSVSTSGSTITISSSSSSSGDITAVTAGNGLTGGASSGDASLAISLTSSGTTTTTSSASGLQFSSGLSLLRGCSDAQTLQWVAATATWDCATGGGLSGSGAAGRVAFWSDTSTLSSNANFINFSTSLFSSTGQISLGSAVQSTGTAFVVIDNPAITATSNQNFFKTLIDNSSAVTITGATTSSIVASLAIDEPNITATGTVTNASTLYISGAPTEGSSGNFALWVDDGQSRFENTPVAGSTTGNALTVVPTYVVEATDITLSGIRLALDSNSNADSGDVFYGFNADDFTTTSGPTEYGLRIGSGYDYQFYFELGTRDLRISATAPSAGTSPLTATIPALAADDTFCLATLANCFGGGGGAGVTYTSQTTNALAKFTSTAGQITSSGITDDGTTVTIAANESLTFTAGSGSISQNYSPAGTTGAARALTITPTFGIDATDQTLTGLYVNPNTNTNTDSGDSLNGILIDTITASSASEYGLQIASGWDQNIYLNDTSTSVLLADGGTITITDGTNTLCSITDAGTTGNLSCTGNLTGGSGGTVGFWARTSTTLSPATANDIVAIANTTTTGADLAITNTGIYTGTGIFNLTADSATAGTVFALSADGITTGKAIDLTSTSNVLDSAILLNVSHSATAATDTSLSADIANISFAPVYSTAVTTPAITGQVLDISRTITTNSSFASTLTVSGALVTISDTATQTTGTLTHTANLLDLTQNYTSSSGTALYVKNYGGASSTSFRVDDESGDTTPFIIDASGQVGIGDSTPSSLVEIGNGTDSIQIDTAGDITFVDADSTSNINGAAGGLSINGADKSGGGGTVSVTAGQGLSGSIGGTLNLTAGSGSLSAAGGTANLKGGRGGSTADGGPVVINSGAGGTASGASGAVTINSANNSVAGQGTGTVTLQSGTVTTGTSGNLTLGTGNASGAGTSGNITIDVGSTVGGTLGTLSIGTTNATSITMGNSGSTVTINSGTPATNGVAYSTDTNGAIAYTAAGTTGQCFIGTTGAAPSWGACSGSASTLQGTYDADADGSDAIIALTTADDSLIFRNPASGGSDSAYVLTLDQLATGAVNALVATNAGTGAVATFDNTNASGNGVLIDVTSADPSQYALLVTSNNGATEGLRVNGFGRTCVGGDCSTVSGVFEIDPTNASLTSNTPALNSAAQTLSVGDGATVAEQKQNQFLAPTIAGVAGGSTETVTDAATVYISGAPAGGNITFTNGPYAFWVDDGISRFDGNVGIGDTSPDADLDIDSTATTGNISGILASAVTSGNLLDISNISTVAAGSDLIQGDHTATYTTTVSLTGNMLDLSRALTTNTGGALTVSGALASLTDNCTQTAGTCTNTANVLSLTQSYTSASGAVLNIANSGTGADIAFNTSPTLTVGDGGTLALTDGTNTIASFVDSGTYGVLRLSDKGSTGDPSCTAGDIYFNATDVTFKGCTATNSWEAFDGTGGETLQGTYNLDVDGSDAIIALTTADDSLIFRNPASGGSDSSYVLTLDQLATGAVNALVATNAGTDYVATFDNTNATGNGVSIDIQSASPSQTAFSVSTNNGSVTNICARGSGETFLGNGCQGLAGKIIFDYPNQTGFSAEIPLFNAAIQILTLGDGVTVANQRNNQFNAQIINGIAGGSTETVTDAATVYIAGQPTGSDITFTNGPYAFWVDDGISRFDGNVAIGDVSPDANLDIDSTATTGDVFGLLTTTLTTGRAGVVAFSSALTATGTTTGLQLNATVGGTNAANTYTINTLDLGTIAGSCGASVTSCRDNAINIGSQALAAANQTSVAINIADQYNATGTHYGICFDCDGTYSNAQPANGITWGNDGTTANNTRLYRSANGTMLAELGDGTDLISAAAATFSINLDDTTSRTERLCHGGGDGGTAAAAISDCSGTPGDYAEQYGSSDPTLEAGDIVVTDPQRNALEVTRDNQLGSKAWIIKAGLAYQQSAIGVVSTNPNETIGKNFDPEENPRPVALNGRVPVKVSLENGPIKSGDYITSSSTPGVGMRATQAGRVIGVALEDFGCTTTPTSEVGSPTCDTSSTCDTCGTSKKILAFVNPTFYFPQTLADNWTNLISLSQTQAQVQNQQAQDLSTLLAQDIRRADELLARLENTHVPTEEEIAVLVKDEISKQLISLGHVNYEASNTAQLADGSVLSAQTNKTLADLDALLQTTNYKLPTLTVTGISQLAQTQVAGTFSQDGTLIIDYGRQINVLGSTLYLQNDALAGCPSGLETESDSDPVSCKGGILVDIGSGRLTIDDQGNLVAQGNLEAGGIVLLESVSNSNIGSSQIPAGSSSITIETTAIKPGAKVLLTATGPTGGKAIYLAEKTDYAGFVVAIESGPAAQNIKFDWLIINTTQVSSN